MLLASFWLRWHPFIANATTNTRGTNAIALPLSTQSSAIVDATGRPVLLRGVNWFGLETENHTPHGLWARDYQEMLAQIKGLGYNVIRLPFSIAALRSKEVTGIDFTIGRNQELENKSPLEILDTLIQEADRQGLLILLDCHQLNDQRIPELWYGDGYTEADWIDTWTMLARRYRNQANVIGADLKNEPHGRASWGTNDVATDWRLAAERAGNAVLAVNPHWLIVVEGVEQNVPGQKLARHWQGGNLEGVKRYPVRLKVARQLVYSPHEYGPGVYDQPWFSEPSFPKNLYNRWETGFHYIATQRIAPVWIGEFGGRQVDARSTEGIWQRQLVQYIQQQKLGFAYWSWNPNSADTGGLLQEDWQTLEADKQALLSKLLPSAPAIARSTPTPTLPQPPNSRQLSSRPQPNVTKPPSRSPARSSGNPSTALQVKTAIESDWQTGFCNRFQITNRSQTAIQGWQLLFQMQQAQITQSWNGNFQRQGRQYQVSPPDWARTIQPNQTIDLGFCANKSGSNYKPQQVKIDRNSQR